jgi:hypothetical protein
METTATPVISTPETRAPAAAIAGPMSATRPQNPVTGLMGLRPVRHVPTVRAATAAAGAVPLWDPASGRFHPVRLRAAIVARGWTVGEFAATAGVSRACLYNALRGYATSDRTAVRIGTTLSSREPLPVLAAE